MLRRLAMVLVLGCSCASANAQHWCLTTSFESDNAWAGNMFDIEPKRDIDLTRWQINTSGTDLVTIEIYWREGSYVGFENDPSAWTLLGSATTQGQGRDYPTSVNVGDLIANQGQIYGIYVHLASYYIGAHHLRWVRGEPTVFENDDLKLTTGVGMRFPAFTGAPSENNMWSGTVCYEYPGPHIVLEGTCPGRITLRWDRTRPDLQAGLCYSNELGSFTLPAGYCQGTVLGLGPDHLQLVRAFRTGPAGEGELSARATQEFCAGYVQVITVDNPCQISNIVQVPQ